MNKGITDRSKCTDVNSYSDITPDMCRKMSGEDVKLLGRDSYYITVVKNGKYDHTVRKPYDEIEDDKEYMVYECGRVSSSGNCYTYVCIMVWTDESQVLCNGDTMKRVSFKVAKAIEKYGYPQCDDWWYDKFGESCYSESDLDELQCGYIVAPTYFNVWLWMWRTKDMKLLLAHPKSSVSLDVDYVYCYDGRKSVVTENLKDPEEAIIQAIDYIVDNDLLKNCAKN